MALFRTAPLIAPQQPVLPVAPKDYDPLYQNQLNNVLRLYFNQLQNFNQLFTTNTGGSLLQFPNGAFHQDGATTLTSAIGNGTTTPIPVTSTADFLSAGGLLIDTEIILYTGKTSTTFTGITRGALGTTSASHSLGALTTEAQAVSSPTTPLAIAFTKIDTSNQVSLNAVNNTHIDFAVAGYYNIQFSTQLANYTTSDDNVTFWFRKNGADVANSAGIVTVPAKHGSIPGTTIVSWNLVLDVLAGNYIELMMTSDSGNSAAVTYPAGTSPAHPVSPSVILTATFVSALYP